MQQKNKQTLRYRLREASGRIKHSYISKQFNSAKDTLAYQDKADTYMTVVISAITLAIIGFVVGLIAGNILLSAILAVGLSLIPIWITTSSLHKYKLFVADELESGLSIISTTYLRQNSFINAVEENIDYLNSPLKEVMQDFVVQVKGVNPNVTAALQNIKPRIKNNVWYEWCNELIKCQSNHSLKSNLMNIVTKFSDVKIVQSDLDTLISRNMHEYKTLLMITLMAVPGIYLLNRDWFNLFFTHIAGKLALAVCAVLVFVSVAKMIASNKPVEYKR